MRRIVLGAVGGVALVLLGVMLTVSFQDAAANGATYLAAFGITGMPSYLQTSAAALILAIILTAVPTFLITRWWVSRPKSVLVDAGPDDYELYSAMRSLMDRMEDYLKYQGYGLGGDDPNAILMDSKSFNLTLLKRGVAVPFVVGGEVQSMFNTLYDFYGRVGPLLRDGHAQEARQLAKSIAEQHPLPKNA
ncbi:MAG TPA: hypothetical protein VGD10_00655 [Allosphingosinicella sp.]|uniref:hypothetical protein n=1 Tax=Allosphingosinicella sp. TaxID=2823234 RepID=UPI002ED9CC39